jgi:hypothetical protein
MGSVVEFKHSNYTILKQIEREAKREYRFLIMVTEGLRLPAWMVLPDQETREMFEKGFIEI